MNYKKIILVGFISAFVAVLTSVLGVAGTVIGSVISSVLYNMLSEALEQPVSSATFSTNFEWEIAYIFPLAVIALIQLLLIFAMLSESGILPAKAHGVIIAFVGIIFLARGFVDMGNAITDLYDDVFVVFDFPIAVLALILIIFVIIRILMSARGSEKEFKIIKHRDEENISHNVKKVHNSKKGPAFDYDKKMEEIRAKRYRRARKPKVESEVQSNNQIVDEKQDAGINKSSANIQFESNDLLDDYKK